MLTSAYNATMVRVLIIGFVAGILAGNGVPYFVRGITGQKHQTPFGNPSSAVVNVVWGWFSLLVAVVLWHFAPMRFHPRAALLAVSLGVLVIGVLLAQTWSSSRK